MPFESIVAFLTGVVLVALGTAFLRRHRRVQAERRDDLSIPEDEKRFYERQHQRRMLTSGLIVVLGLLIPLGFLLIDRQPPLPGPVVALFWIGVLLIVLFVLLLGLIDLFATGLHARNAMHRVQIEKAALERQLEEIRRSLREGGR